MAISARATSTGPNNQSTSHTINLPTGTTTGDVTIIALALGQTSVPGATGGTPAIIVPPAGWTTIASGGGCAIFYRAWQSGDPSSVTFTSAINNFWESVAVSYIGVDATTPIDTFASCFASQNGGTASAPPYLAPPVCPNYAGSLLLGIFLTSATPAGTITGPAGYTSRVSSGNGPCLWIGDKALTDGTPTAAARATLSRTGSPIFLGSSVALKASGAAATSVAAARPVIVAMCEVVKAWPAGAGSLAVSLDYHDVRDGDVVVVCFNGIRTFTAAPSGYTQRTNAMGATIYTHTWHTGDTTSPTWTLANDGSNTWETMFFFIVRKQGVSANAVQFEQASVATGNPTATSPSLTPLGSADLLCVYIGTNETATCTFSSITAGLAQDFTDTFGPSFIFEWGLPSANPTGSFSATASVANLEAAATMLFSVPAASANRNFGYVLA